MSLGTWRFKSSHPHSETPRHPLCGGSSRRLHVGQRAGGKARADDRGRRDPEGAGPDRLRPLAHVGPPRDLRPRARGGAGGRRAQHPRRDPRRRRSAGATASSPTASRVVVPSAEVGRLAHVPGVAKVWPNVDYGSLGVSVSRISPAPPAARAAGDRRRQALGPDARDRGQRDEDRRSSTTGSTPATRSSTRRLRVPARLPEGPDRCTTPKVIVQRTFAPPSPALEVRDDALRPEQQRLVPRHARRRHRRRRPRHRWTAAIRLSGVAPSAYLGNYKALTIPTPGFGLDGNSAEIAAAIEAAVADGMNVINLSLGEPEIEPSRDIVVARDRRRRGGRRRAGDRGRQRLRPVRLRLGQLARRTRPTRSPSRRRPTPATIADFSSAGPDAGLAAAQARRQRARASRSPRRSRPTRAARAASSTGTSMATPQVAGGVALLKQRHPTGRSPQIKSALVQTGDPVHDRRRPRGLGAPRGRRADRPRPGRQPAALRRADRRSRSRSNGGARTVEPHRRRRRRGAWSVAVALQEHARRRHGHRSADASPCPGDARGDRHGRAVGAQRRRHRLRHPHPRHRHAPDPVLGRGRPSRLGTERTIPLTRPGTYNGTTRGGASCVSRYRYPTGGDTSYPGPEVVYRVHDHEAASRTSASPSLSGRAVPHVVFAGDENHLVGYAGLPVSINPYFDTFGESRPIAGAVLPAAGHLRHRLRHPVRGRAPARSRSATG